MIAKPELKVIGSWEVGESYFVLENALDGKGRETGNEACFPNACNLVYICCKPCIPLEPFPCLFKTPKLLPPSWMTWTGARLALPTTIPGNSLNPPSSNFPSRH